MKLSNDLKTQARELRELIIDACSSNGGHIGASLGAVELTLALHAEFNSPRDSIVWDVGHQTYAHKILTGRDVTKIRQAAGPSGFSMRAESDHDAFGAGHSSTSISAALGIAEAKRLLKDETWTIAVIGDGGLTAGLAYEALNQAGASAEPRLLIVVNDNNLSISPNVGALDRWAFGTEREPRKFFESLGFHYIGPVDGHDLDVLKQEFNKIKNAPPARVAVLHVRTVKGKGFEPAEKDPVRFHGVGPFDKITGKAEGKGGALTYSQVFAKKLSWLAASDSSIVALTAAMAEGTSLTEFESKFPDRFYDVGIAEAHCLVFAAGLATRKLKPVPVIYSTFLQRAVDSVIHDIALQELPIVLGIDRAGLVGADGPTHHGIFDIAILRAIPGVSIAAPSSREDLEAMLETALHQPGLKAIRYPRGAARRLEENADTVVNPGWGRARRCSPNAPLLIWGLGQGFVWALEAMALLSPAEREQICLMDARFAKPVDLDLLKKTLVDATSLITIEDGCIAGGFGSALIEGALQMGLSLPKKVELLGVSDKWVGHAEIQEQREALGLSAQQIAAKLKVHLAEAR